jgi:LuxR family transcriptional regulator
MNHSNSYFLTIFEAISPHIHRLDFSAYEYRFRRRMPFGETKALLCTNINGAAMVVEHNHKRSVHLTHAIHSQNAIIWSQEFFRDSPEEWKSTKATGYALGCTIPSQRDMEYAGALSVARQGSIFTQSELDEKNALLQHLSNDLFDAIKRHYTPYFAKGIDHITHRELETMRWIADGKTSLDVSKILGISERTVNFHVNNVITRLGVQNKTAAAVQLAVRGLLY